MIKGVSSTRSNIIANFAGKAWTGIINIPFVPFYIKFLGIAITSPISKFQVVRQRHDLIKTDLDNESCANFGKTTKAIDCTR